MGCSDYKSIVFHVNGACSSVLCLCMLTSSLNAAGLIGAFVNNQRQLKEGLMFGAISQSHFTKQPKAFIGLSGKTGVFIPSVGQTISSLTN